MGDIIFLSERMSDRSRPSSDASRFFFALGDPFSYLVGERIERALGSIDWVPVLGPFVDLGDSVAEIDRDARAQDRLELAEREAKNLDLPFVEPHRYPMDHRAAARAAAFAVESGVGPAFAIAMARMAFCGGYDISSSSVIAEAAASARLNPYEAIAASAASQHDLQLDATTRGLRSRRITVPAISIGHSWFDGPDALVAAVNFSVARRMQTPSAPVS